MRKMKDKKDQMKRKKLVREGGKEKKERDKGQGTEEEG